MNGAVAAGAPPANPILSAPVLPTLLRLALPNLAAMLAATLVAVAETVYVGRLGTAPLAAIALVFPLVMLMQMLSAGAMGGGVSSAISRALGGGDRARAEQLAVHACVIGLLVGSAFSVLFATLAEPLLRLLGGRGAVLEQAVIYARVALAAAVLTWMLNTLASIVRGTGDMRVPSAALLAAAGLQVAVGGGLGLGIGSFAGYGIAGVAAGLAVAYAIAAGFLLWFLCSGRARITLRLRPVTLSTDMFLDILKVGAVSALSPLQTTLTVLILTALAARFGTTTLAGYGIGARLEFLLVPIVFAVGVAAVPMVGMAIGARDVARARRVAWTAAGVAVAVLGIVGLTVTAVPGAWSGLFTQDRAVRAAADLYLVWAGPGFAFLGLGLSLYFASQGSGRMLPPVLAGMARLLVIGAGGVALVAADAPAWALFALVAASMVAYGLSTAAAVYLTRWGPPSGLTRRPA